MAAAGEPEGVVSVESPVGREVTTGGGPKAAGDGRRKRAADRTPRATVVDRCEAADRPPSADWRPPATVVGGR
jgi:hypothetical protein